MQTFDFPLLATRQNAASSRYDSADTGVHRRLPRFFDCLRGEFVVEVPRGKRAGSEVHAFRLNSPETTL